MVLTAGVAPAASCMSGRRSAVELREDKMARQDVARNERRLVGLAGFAPAISRPPAVRDN